MYHTNSYYAAAKVCYRSTSKRGVLTVVSVTLMIHELYWVCSRDHITYSGSWRIRVTIRHFWDLVNIWSYRTLQSLLSKFNHHCSVILVSRFHLNCYSKPSTVSHTKILQNHWHHIFTSHFRTLGVFPSRESLWLCVGISTGQWGPALLSGESERFESDVTVIPVWMHFGGEWHNVNIVLSWEV